MLAACAGPMRVPEIAQRPLVRDFAIDARFALRLESPSEREQSVSGRLSWRHRGAEDLLLLADPMGQGVAELESGPGGAKLRLASGEVRTAPDAERLLRDTLGYSLPVGRLPAWLLGNADAGGALIKDAAGRPQRLVENGWQIDYGYESDAAEALPARLTVRREGELELRLRIEEWRTGP